ncbi:MAG: nicotinate phosphoribosyltransferase [Nitrospiraceae bacterium]|nr:nicotinate phosphoribosyltransferase [Nitrospiraceae bacterium]
MRIFHTAEPGEVVAGRITDIYFNRTLRILRAKGVNPVVKAEFIAKDLPKRWPWGVFAGLEEALHVLKGLPVRVRAMREGEVFYPYEPVMEIEGRYQDFCVYETALLGLICQASGVATQAARFKSLVGERLLISFGARRMHPVLAPMIERNAYIGGADGVSVVESGEIIGREAMGTMPHSLVLCMGSTLEALKAFDEVIGPEAARVALIDTLMDEKFECINVAGAFGGKLDAVRFDTPASRRGNFYRILEECRWELDLRGHGHVRFFVSGGIKEEDVPVLNPLVAGYGIGTAISNAPVIDYAMDIMEMEGKPFSKVGKWGGSKRVLKCAACGARHIAPNRPGAACPCGSGPFTDVLVPVLDEGRVLLPGEDAGAIRQRTLANTAGLPLL